ncbi:EAL domain-containing protein [Cupriavidus plantarum]|uniref:PAS domain S-box-containing protein/diguanylate cyclase (GGDEF)-like protein n=1 Tax=Cupriavidus plantarum TaxID=942865 RepID=A0A316EP39_9BURK|nr:EAL domain-containing protein [Cupriavidus plantarum]PWK34058.1 PAS domain S-box-containing protein/diguanylate cyclase (GGDEF)-like protein [Cupriavidus plantarum]
MTENARLRLTLENYCQRFRLTLQAIGEGVIVLDAAGRVDYLNPIAEQLTGWSLDEARGRPSEVVCRLVDEHTRLSLRRAVRDAVAHGTSRTMLGRAILQSRHCLEHRVEVAAAAIPDVGDADMASPGASLGGVLTFRDVSEQYRLGREMEYRATHDALTGIINRDEFDRRLNATLAEARASHLQHALMFIDLDQFKLVNDAVGHAAGDELLRQIVRVIRRSVRATDVIARLGGDEFGVVFSQCSIESAQAMANKICRDIDQFRFQFAGQRFHVGASAGLVPVDERWTTSAALLQAADSACYAAKAEGRNRVHTYLPADEIVEAHREEMQWARRIETALDRNQFVLYWQRVMPLQIDNCLVHAELLLRMVDDNGNLVNPGAFLGVAERFHLATRIDRWVVRTVFAWMHAHREELDHVGTVAINLSGLSIGDRDFHRFVKALLETTAFDHHKICFEITETSAIMNLAEASSFIGSMRVHGVRFALDDFGAGAASFGYLRNLDVDYLKIDGQFIRGLSSDRVNQATVRCIRDVANITGQFTVAEFVETEAVESLLREIGIDFAQGYLRHRPAPLADIFALRV